MSSYDVAAYIWPAYTGTEPRTFQFWEQGIGEWQTVKNPTFKQAWNFKNPQPLWGYVDEADKAVMEMQINAAADHGVNVFIYDWYWYDNRPFLEQCLNDGYLKAKNNDRVKFYLMWANHNVTYLWDKRNSHINNLIWTGMIDEKQFDAITDRLIEKYFSHPSYYKIDGCPVFMVYDVKNLINGLGGIDISVKAVKLFREKVKSAGFPDLHFQLCAWSEGAVNLGGIDATRSGSTKDIARIMGFDSLTNYQFVHIVGLSAYKNYLDVLKDIKKEWERIDRDYSIPYYPHISVGWDNNLRHKHFVPGIITDNTPENFEKGLLMAKEYLDRHPNITPLITVNSWNEWTEGSYLEPDTVNGYGYLEAIKRVFKL